MNDSKINDRRGQQKPDRERFVIYPTCRTCKHFEHFVNKEGQSTDLTICVIDPPKIHVQIKGVDDNGQEVWATWAGWPPVYPGSRCGKYAAREAN